MRKGSDVCCGCSRDRGGRKGVAPEPENGRSLEGNIAFCSFSSYSSSSSSSHCEIPIPCNHDGRREPGRGLELLRHGKYTHIIIAIYPSRSNRKDSRGRRFARSHVDNNAERKFGVSPLCSMDNYFILNPNSGWIVPAGFCPWVWRSPVQSFDPGALPRSYDSPLYVYRRAPYGRPQGSRVRIKCGEPRAARGRTLFPGSPYFFFVVSFCFLFSRDSPRKAGRKRS